MSDDSSGTPTTMSCRHRGPLVVEGEFELRGTDGQLIELGGGKKIRLCRCGATANGPFCDGSHNRTQFEADVEA